MLWLQVGTISDKEDYKVVMGAMKSMGLSNTQIETLWKIVAAILHLVKKV